MAFSEAYFKPNQLWNVTMYTSYKNSDAYDKKALFYTSYQDECVSGIKSVYQTSPTEAILQVGIPVDMFGEDISMDVSMWVEFLNKCMLPCTFVGIKSMNGFDDHKVNWGQGHWVKNNSFYMVEVYASHLKSANHMLAVNTALRYFWSNIYRGIASAALEMLDKYGARGMTPLDALVMAHYVKPETYDSYRGLIHFPGETSFQNISGGASNTGEEYFVGPPTEEQLLERLKHEGYSGDAVLGLKVNSLLPQPKQYSEEFQARLKRCLEEKWYWTLCKELKALPEFAGVAITTGAGR